MIPEFNDHGYLPPGIHPATLDEIAERFGKESELRLVEMESLVWLMDLAKRAGVTRIIVNGSFVTDVMEPNDVDCVLLTGVNYPHEREAAEGLANGLPFLEIHIVEPDDFQFFIDRLYASDRQNIPKGMIEVLP